MFVLVGDIGGTNCRLALFRGSEKAFERPIPRRSRPASTWRSRSSWKRPARRGPRRRPQRACFGVAGPVENDTSKVTNLPWFIDARKLEQRLKIPRVALLNDFQAAALGVTVLGDEHLVPLGGGPRNPTGPCVVTGAGTGLGEAFLVWSPGENRYQVVPSEGGHMDFTPRTAARERALPLHGWALRPGLVRTGALGRGHRRHLQLPGQRAGLPVAGQEETRGGDGDRGSRGGGHPAGPGRQGPSASWRSTCSSRCWAAWPATWP